MIEKRGLSNVVAQKLTQLLGHHGCHRVLALGPGKELTLGKSLSHEPVTIVLISQESDHGFRAIDKHVDHPVLGVLVKVIATQSGKTVDALSKVLGSGSDAYLAAAIESNHDEICVLS